MRPPILVLARPPRTDCPTCSGAGVYPTPEKWCSPPPRNQVDACPTCYALPNGGHCPIDPRRIPDWFKVKAFPYGFRITSRCGFGVDVYDCGNVIVHGPPGTLHGMLLQDLELHYFPGYYVDRWGTDRTVQWEKGNDYFDESIQPGR